MRRAKQKEDLLIGLRPKREIKTLLQYHLARLLSRDVGENKVPCRNKVKISFFIILDRSLVVSDHFFVLFQLEEMYAKHDRIDVRYSGVFSGGGKWVEL